MTIHATTLAEQRLDIIPRSGRIGAELRGIQLSGALESHVINAILAALYKYKVVFVRGQLHLDDAQHEAFAARLGELARHPNAPVKEGTKTLWALDSDDGIRANSWHTDITYIPNYPAASILRAVELPPVGGDTMWANTATGYASLPAPLKVFADNLRSIHSNSSDYSPTKADIPADAKIFSSRKIETEHPLVRIHPVTGERTLILGHFFRRFKDIPVTESLQLYTLFQSYVTRPENVVRWHWAPGDLAIWDNRATQHYALNDYNERRVMHRVTIAGDVPVGVDGRSSVVLMDTGA